MPRTPQPDAALAAVLKRTRGERGLTQEAVAWHAGVAVATLAKVENAQTVPSWDSVRRIASAMDLSLADLGRLVEAEG